MAIASIQITQGVLVGVAGRSLIGLTPTGAITLTDAGGPGATSYQWEFLSYPSPLASPPTITNPTSQVATITPPGGGLLDGTYLLRVTRTDVTDGVTVDDRFFTIADADGLVLPSPGMNRTNANIGGSALAQAAGWSGSQAAGTNIFQDAFLRLRRLREGRYVGRSQATTYASSSPGGVTLIFGTNHPFQAITLTSATAGTGDYTVALSLANAVDGARFWIQASLQVGAADVILTNGVGGSVIYTASPGTSTTLQYALQCRFNGTAWTVLPHAIPIQAEQIADHETRIAALESSGGSVVVRPFDSVLDLSASYFQNYNGNGTEACVLAIGLNNPTTLKAEVVTYIPADSASELIAPSDLGNGGSDPYPPHWDIFDPASDYAVIVTVLATDTYVSTGRNLGLRNTALPTLVSATIDLNVDADLLEVEMSDRMVVPTLAGLVFTSDSGAVTISDIVSGQGTSTLGFQLSTSIPGGATCSFEFQNARTIQSLNGPKPATGSHAVTILGGFETANLTGRTLHLRADLGNGGLADGAAFASWTSQAPGAYAYIQATGANRPVLDVDGVHGDLPSCNSDGTNDVLASSATVANLCGAGGSDWYLAGIFRALTVTGTNIGYNQNQAIIADPAGYWGLLIRDLGTGFSELFGYIYDGTIRVIRTTLDGSFLAGRMTTGQNYHFALRHTGGNLRIYLNGTLCATLAVNAINGGGLTQTTRLFQSAGNQYANINLHEIVMCSPDPGDIQHAQLMDYYDARLA